MKLKYFLYAALKYICEVFADFNILFSHLMAENSRMGVTKNSIKVLKVAPILLK